MRRRRAGTGPAVLAGSRGSFFSLAANTVRTPLLLTNPLNKRIRQEHGFESRMRLLRPPGPARNAWLRESGAPELSRMRIWRRPRCRPRDSICSRHSVLPGGWAYRRFRRTLDQRNVTEALSAASELQFGALAEALELTLLLADQGAREVRPRRSALARSLRLRLEERRTRRKPRGALPPRRHPRKPLRGPGACRTPQLPARARGSLRDICRVGNKSASIAQVRVAAPPDTGWRDWPCAKRLIPSLVPLDLRSSVCPSRRT
jgi:hypothetical protein